MSFEAFNDIIDCDRYYGVRRKSTQEVGERKNHVVQVVLQGGAIQAKSDG